MLIQLQFHKEIKMKARLLIHAQKGQVIPIIVIAIFAILAMVAVLLDGGMLMYNRRVAQNAADAGALAGARILCDGGTATDAGSTAASYANLNKASTVNTTVVNRQITVNTTISNPSFFAKLFKINSLETAAQASAGCCVPSEMSRLLPVAWSCRAPATGSTSDPSQSKECGVHYLDWSTELKPIISGTGASVQVYNYISPGSPLIISTPFDISKDFIPGYIYIIMDSDQMSDEIALSCSTGSISCTLAGVFSGGDKGWLDFSGGSANANELKDWVENGYAGTISEHTWLPGSSGVKNVVFQYATDLVGKVVKIPVFNGVCSNNPNYQTSCITPLHPVGDPDDTVVPTSGSATYYHVNGFSAFLVTCVNSNGNNTCPGFKQARINNPSLSKNMASIEGYFIDNYPTSPNDVGTCNGTDIGFNIVSLTQ
jgi:Flp pilus assembly protein TadG